jgi:hypothetical protein
MIRKLLIVFASGLVLSVVALCGAWALGGDQFITAIDEGDGISIDLDGNDEPVTSRTLAFDGAKMLTVDMPVSLRFTRGPKPEMTVSGPASLVARLRWENGELSLGDRHRWGNRTLDVTITAPELAGLVLRSAGDIELEDLDQKTLKLDVKGAADLDASGKVNTLAVKASGAGDLDLARLAVTDAKVDIAGVGDVDIAATGKVEADIAGVGSVTLHRKPRELVTRTSGIGSIEHAY